MRETITSVSDIHRSGQDVFHKVCRSRIEDGPVIEAEITMVLKSGCRRLTARSNESERAVDGNVYEGHAISHLSGKAGSLCLWRKTTRNVAYQLSYSKETRLLRDFSKLCNISRESVMSYLCKRTKALRKETPKL